jgi:hypothetical protein
MIVAVHASAASGTVVVALGGANLPTALVLTGVPEGVVGEEAWSFLDSALAAIAQTFLGEELAAIAQTILDSAIARTFLGEELAAIAQTFLDSAIARTFLGEELAAIAQTFLDSVIAQTFLGEAAEAEGGLTNKNIERETIVQNTLNWR